MRDPGWLAEPYPIRALPFPPVKWGDAYVGRGCFGTGWKEPRDKALPRGKGLLLQDRWTLCPIIAMHLRVLLVPKQ